MQTEYNTWKTNTNSKIKKMDNAVPSFAGDTITLEIDKKHKLTDSDGHLEDYPTVNKITDGIKFEHTKGSNDLYITATDTCTSENYTFRSENVGLALHYGGSTSKVYLLDGDLQRTTYTNYYPVDPFFRLRLNIKLNGGLTIKKFNSNGDSLAGCTFRIWSEDTGYSSSEVTPENGVITIDSLKAGTYHVQETLASSGYLQNQTIYDVEVKAGDKAEVNIVTVSNQEPRGQITVTKKNANGDILGAGFKFKIVASEKITNKVGTITYYNAGDTVATLTTTSEGTAVKSELPLGSYTITEENSDALDGYLINKEPKTVSLIYKDQNANVVYASTSITNDEPRGQITVTKKNANGDVLGEGFKFKITASEKITNKAGTITYYNAGDTVAILTTTSEGTAVKSKLPLGSYTITEENSDALDGYLINKESKTATLTYKDPNTDVIYTSISISNDEPTGELQVIKTDKETGNNERVDGTVHHGDASLKGATYTLYADEDIYNVAKTVKYFSQNEEIGTFTFNASGVATTKITNKVTKANIKANGNKITGLPMGNFRCSESVVPEGYTKDNNIYRYNFKYKDQNTKIIPITGKVENIVQKAPFEVIKVTTNDNTIADYVEGAEFTAILNRYVEHFGSFDEALKHLEEYAEDEYSIFKTSSNGHGTSKLLAFGDYTVRETYTPSPEIEAVEDFYVTIDKDSKTPVKELVANDLPFESYLKLVKEDKKSGKTVTFSNATFNLYKLNEENNTWEKVSCKVGKDYFDSWTTDQQGIARTENKLKAGKYKVSELVIPNGFLQLDNELTFEINNRNKTLEYDKDLDAWITVVVQNEQPAGTLKLNKKVALRKDIDKTMIKDIDFTKISFELVADETIIDYADGSIIYEKGAVVGNYNLKADGTLTIANLPMSKYHLKELTTIEGAVLDETEHKIVFEQKDTITKEYIVEADIENKTTVIEISKTDITGEKELVGAKLTVTNEKNEIIDSWVSTEKTHYIEGLEVGKTYTLIEEIAPEEYVKATSIKFTVENTAEIQKVVMVDKQVIMSKEDIAGNEIEGAELKVVDKDQNIVDSWTSTKQVHKIKGLTEGETYTLYEEYVPNGFVISNEVTFTVTTDKETQKVEMIDKVVEISKINIAGEELEGATLVVTSTKTKNIVDKWVSTKEAHKVSGLIEGESYILHEEIAVDGYVKATDIEFTVTEDKATQKIQMVDKVVEIIKTDLVTGEELEGAELKVVDEDENIIDSWTSTKIPHKVVGLEEGKNYKLIEITSPYGFEIAEEILFTVTEEKETQRIEMKDMPILTDIHLVKIDAKTKEVIKTGFKFGLYEDESCTKLIKEFKSNKDTGTITFDSLRYGTVFAKELTSPKGYTLSDKVIKIEVNDQGVFVDSNKIEEKDNIYSFEFENEKVPVIQTGNETNYILLSILAATSLIGMIVGIIRVKNKKKFNNK